MKKSYSCGDNRLSDKHEILGLFWDLKFHYHVHMSPPLDQMNPNINTSVTILDIIHRPFFYLK
jgi:hypothetical protein